MAKTYRVRPAELLGVTSDSFTAFCIDRAVWYFGVSVEADMDAAEKALPKNSRAERVEMARDQVFLRYMASDVTKTTTPPKGRYADPMAAMKARDATAGR